MKRVDTKSPITSLDALRAVYERGERCRECGHKFTEREPERLPGRRTEYTAWRGCDILESQNRTFAREAIECAGVEDELTRSEDDVTK